VYGTIRNETEAALAGMRSFDGLLAHLQFGTEDGHQRLAGASRRFESANGMPWCTGSGAETEWVGC